MSVVAVVGECATTTAVGLAATWPFGERAVLAELDPAGGCLSAWLDLPRTPSLSQLVASADAGTWPVIEATFQRSPLGLDVLVAPTRAVEAAAAVVAASTAVLPVLTALVEPVVIADGGRVRAALSPVVASAALAVVVHRQHDGSAAAAAVGLERVAHLCELLAIRSIPYIVGLVGGTPYRADEVAAFIGAPTVMPIEIDPWAAAVFAGRAASALRLRRSRLWRSLEPLAAAASARLREGRRELAWGDSSLDGERADRSMVDPREGGRRG